MNTPDLYFAVAIGIFCSTLVLIAGYYYVRGRRSTQAEWDDLFAKLAWIDSS